MRLSDKADFDVIILGAGIAGTMLASILARRNHSVLILDRGVHPRFAIGESTIPQTSQLLTLLAREHDVPELNNLGLGSPELLRQHISRNCGIKRAFGFAYHRLGQEHDPDEAHLFGNVWRDENHLFRQDIDSYLFTTAIRYGAHAIQGVSVDKIDLRDDSVELMAGGKRYTTRFLVDGTGFRSLLADTLALREDPCSLVTRTRSIFTHMVDVTPFEEVVTSKMSRPWSMTTLHHCFKRGWAWVIPFNNWEGAPNQVVSVGLTLDEQLHPELPDTQPDEEFARFLESLPSVARQFEQAKPVRPWVRTKRIQYFSTRSVGARWALLSHASGFIDPLFSRGLVNTVDNLRSLSRALMAALDDDEFTEERFELVDQEQTRNIRFADKIVAGSYIAWDDFELWNAWLRLWAAGTAEIESHLGSKLLMGEHSRYKPTKAPISSEYEAVGYRALFEAMWDALRRYDAGDIDLEQARARLWTSLENYPLAVALPEGFDHHEWAMKHPQCRDLFLGDPEKHQRWGKALIDEHLT